MVSEENSGQELFVINDDLRELIPHFVMHQFEELQQMETSLEAGNLKEVGRLGHSLKGAAANFCLDPLSRLGMTIQDVSKLGMEEALLPLVKKYRFYLDELKVQVS
ncbi:Hpt domain-containing protein [Desulfovibrio sp. JC010]|uniref:Hpt domain-containing protein n=1 Tax=Desulfovibrio sp. JC010 TaxID=2593641 RepID=UPI0013D1E1E2|nr:Hpt domain-containing protein [Desulfovibrio sp. JC010]NDV25766.1 Hpt domain-containing protein [Desulfovibrio sp. JC010]